MKKITILFSILIASISAFAATTLQITMSSANQGDKVLRIVVDNPFSNADDNGYDAVVGAGQQGGLYIVYNSDRYTKYYTNELGNNLPLGFGAVEDSEYTFNFSYFTGTSFTIYDKKLGKTITVADNILVDGVAADPANKYTFSIEDEEKNTAINDRFVINYVPAPVYSVKTNIDGWASYSSDVNLVAPAGLTVYAGTIVDEELSLTSVDYIKANEGVIVKGEAGLTYTLTPGSGSDSYTNDLKPSSAWASHSGTIYCLHNEGVGTTAFYQYTGSDMPANKAYLQISTTPSSAPKRISMRFNQPTAIENVELETVKAEKFIENGQVLIKRGEIIYNVQGQIVK